MAFAGFLHDGDFPHQQGAVSPDRRRFWTAVAAAVFSGVSLRDASLVISMKKLLDLGAGRYETSAFLLRKDSYIRIPDINQSEQSTSGNRFIKAAVMRSVYI
jgi:hypothetical protein